MIEAVDLAYGPFERAAHDEPHDELYTFRARFAQVLLARNAREGLGIRDDVVEETRVELLVDEAGARTLELVAHAARAPDLHVEIRIEAVDRAAQRPAKLITAKSRGRRVLHDVHRERDHEAGPGVSAGRTSATRGL